MFLEPGWYILLQKATDRKITVGMGWQINPAGQTHSQVQMLHKVITQPASGFSIVEEGTI